MPTSYSWPLVSPPAPTTGLDESPSAASILAAGVSRRPRRGILFPFRRDGVSDFASGVGGSLIASAVRQILGTRCTSPHAVGELPWRSNFGSLIYLAVHKNNNAVLEALVRQWAVDALARWLSSVRVTDVRVEPAKDPSGHETILTVHVNFEILARGGDVLGRDSTTVALAAIGRT